LKNQIKEGEREKEREKERDRDRDRDKGFSLKIRSHKIRWLEEGEEKSLEDKVLLFAKL
jgi:hypothetical protein